MVVDTVDEEAANLLFHALADATRRDILRRAMRGENSVTDLARAYPMSFAAVQKHVAVLEDAGLITKQPNGRQRIVRSDIAAIRGAKDLLDEFEVLWRDRLDRLEAILDEQPKGEKP